MKPTKKLKKKVELGPIQAKRVAILKDAIKQIKIEAYIIKAANGYVVSVSLHDQINDLCAVKPRKTEMKSLLPDLINPTHPCELCAKGAILISSIRKFNNFSLDKAEYGGLDNFASDRARTLFGKDNADLMERYFEGGPPDNIHLSYFENFHRRAKWLALDDTKRLLLIFENAIKNKGIFKPNQIEL